MNLIKKLVLPIGFLILFYAIAFWRYAATGKIFYVYNFGYIGTALALGLSLSALLPRKKIGYARCTALLLVGAYLFIYVGVIDKENLQIEGFWFYLLAGHFAGATLHYFIAKIAGTVLFNRGWCGWACWTAMVLDFLPWREPKTPINRKLTTIRYAHFFLVMTVIVILYYRTDFGANFKSHDDAELSWFLIGNIAYYAIAITLAAALRDNRAFCKYVCPIPVFMKVGAKAALLRNEIRALECTECGECERHCPMQIELLRYKRDGSRILSTECILCQTCESVCPKRAIKMTFKIDVPRRKRSPASAVPAKNSRR